MARLARLTLTALLIPACSVQMLTVADIEGKRYASIEELSIDFECPGDMLGTFDLGPADSEEAALAVATTALRMQIDNISERPVVDSVIDAGGVWLVADQAGLIIAAVANPSGFSSMCAR